MNGVKSWPPATLSLRPRSAAVVEAVRAVFEKLGEFDIDEEKFDRQFALEVERRVDDHCHDLQARSRLDVPISIKEVKKAVGKMKRGKAPGNDGIISEWLIYGGEEMTKALWLLVSTAWHLECSPSEWSKGLIFPIYKDGDTRDPLNYRGITLLSVVAKCYAAILNERLMRWCEDTGALTDEQGGFRRTRGPPEQIFILDGVLKLRRGQETHTCFIGIKKAFDSVLGIWSGSGPLACAGRCGE